MTYTRQSHSLPIVNGSDYIKNETFSAQHVTTESPEADEIINNLFTIQRGLNDLYIKLQRLNYVLIRNRQKEKGEEYEN